MITFIALLLVGLHGAFGVDHDPEIKMTTPEIVVHWGYPVETHLVTTSDGYILEMHRIPHGKNDIYQPGRPVVYLQHGLMCSSSNWVTNLPDQSAGFIFADAGYDVWMGNIRGNTYGRRHQTLDPKKEKFWEFSFDEHQAYDLPAMVDYVLKTTGKQKLHYVGHSQGTLMMFTHLSEDQTFAQKIENFFALAPIGTVNHIRGLMRFVADNFGLDLDLLYKLFGAGEFLPSSNFMKLVAQFLCGDNPTNPLCSNVFFLIAGPESNQLNKTRTDVYAAHTPAGASSQNVIHWVQMVHRQNRVQKFDYMNKLENVKHYGQEIPPLYDYSKVNAPVYLYWGDEDFLGDPKDIENFLLLTLPKENIKANVQLKDYNHVDFIWGLKAPKEIYQPILEVLKGGSQ